MRKNVPSGLLIVITKPDKKGIDKKYFLNIQLTKEQIKELKIPIEGRYDAIELVNSDGDIISGNLF